MRPPRDRGSGGSTKTPTGPRWSAAPSRRGQVRSCRGGGYAPNRSADQRPPKFFLGGRARLLERLGDALRVRSGTGFELERLTAHAELDHLAHQEPLDLDRVDIAQRD